MRTLKHLALLLTITLAAASCSNEENEAKAPAKGGKEVKFDMNISGSNSRTATDPSDRTTTWTTGDAVGIFVYADETLEYINVKYVYDGTDWKAATNGIRIEDGTSYKYYAYYPYQEGVLTPNNVSLAALDDQNSGEGYDKSDVLVASNETGAVNEENNIVTLTFKHVYAMVEVTLFGDKVTQDPTAVKLPGIQLNGSVNLVNQDVTLSGNKTEVTMKYLGEQKGIRAYRAVVPAQTIAAGDSLVAIYGANTEVKGYTFKYNKDVPYVKGQYRVIEVKIGKDDLSITIPQKNMNIDPWNPADKIDGGAGSYEEIVERLIQPVGDAFGNNNEYVTTPAAEEGWYKFAKDVTEQGKSVFEIVTDPTTTWGKSVKLTYAPNGANNSYYISTISYVTGAIPQTESNAYKLTAKIKSSSASGPLVFTIRDNGNNSSFACSNSESTFLKHRVLNFNGSKIATMNTAKITTPNTWVDYTLYIDLNHKAAGSPGSISEDKKNSFIDNTDFSKIEIRIYTNSTNETYSIEVSDVALEAYTVPAE